MKKLLTAAVLALLSTGAFAQTTQRSIVVSGTLGINRSQDEIESNSDPRTNTITSFALKPSIGYMVSDRLELGMNIGLNYSKTELVIGKESYKFTSESVSTSVEFSPFVRKYFMLSEKLAFTGTASAGFSLGNNKTENNFNSTKTESTRNCVFASIVPGITFFPTEKIGLSTYFGSLGYTKVTFKPKEGSYKEVQSDFGLNLSSSTFGIGFSYYINR
ncbi:outer membrane beta-barrel protein [Pontibacter fetidus]|uniref:Outer membrane beta-barrel protein n=1 Tax=Pontibacter fetidus TaxID=2700082 RepID=A0A6B2H849_9BACT|nr:outer membrane beta-barrel protein [Pontibacter fetidus]NDK55354.1 outer membrane beta-barrel protein [Pontibacter fetidus]